MSRNTKPLLQVDANNRLLQQSGDWTTFRGEYNVKNLVYAGYARPGADEGSAVWQIMKLNYDGLANLVSIQWPVNADGAVSSDFEFAWTGHAALTYR